MGVISVVNGKGTFGDEVGSPSALFKPFAALGTGCKAVVKLHTDAGVYASGQVSLAGAAGAWQSYDPAKYGRGQVLDVINSYEFQGPRRVATEKEDRSIGTGGLVLLDDGRGVGVPLISWQHDDTITWTFLGGNMWNWDSASIHYSSADPKTNAVFENSPLNRTAPDLLDR